jgi:hypothetical protein
MEHIHWMEEACFKTFVNNSCNQLRKNRSALFGVFELEPTPVINFILLKKLIIFITSTVPCPDCLFASGLARSSRSSETYPICLGESNQQAGQPTVGWSTKEREFFNIFFL